MKKILTFFAIIILNNTYLNSQTILPNTSTEFCPNTEYTFNASLPKKAVSLIGQEGAVVTVYPTFSSYSITFKGYFQDYNKKQLFKVTYEDGSFYDFEFKKIKSLYGPTCTNIYVPLSITAEACKEVTIPINFGTIQWRTLFEPESSACFGTINNYEYQLPTGWTLNSQTSTGSNWISGSNNVTILSDINTGAGETIKIRPKGDCTGSIINNQPIASININRPKPNLTFSAPNPICNIETYTATGIPPIFSNYSWSSTPSGLVTISSPNSNTTQVTRLVNGLGTVSFNIWSSICASSFSYNTQEITGLPQLITGIPSTITGMNMQMLSNDCYSPIDRYTVIGGLGATTFNWYYRRVSAPSSSFTLKKSGPENFYNLTGGRPGRCDDIEIKVEAFNNCNTSTPFTYIKSGIQCRCTKEEALNGYKTLSITPSSSNNSIQVQLIESYNAAKKVDKIERIRIFDKMGNLKKEIKVYNLKVLNIDISDLSTDIYSIQVFDGIKWVTKQFSKL